MGIFVYKLGGSLTAYPLLTLGYRVARQSRNVLHPLLGSSSTVAVTYRPPAPRVGVLRLLCYDEQQAQEIMHLHSISGPTGYEDTDIPSAKMLYTVTDGQDLVAELDPETRVRWTIEIPFTELT